MKKILRGHTKKDICGYGLEKSVLVKCSLALTIYWVHTVPTILMVFFIELEKKNNQTVNFIRSHSKHLKNQTEKKEKQKHFSIWCKNILEYFSHQIAWY